MEEHYHEHSGAIDFESLGKHLNLNIFGKIFLISNYMGVCSQHQID